MSPKQIFHLYIYIFNHFCYFWIVFAFVSVAVPTNGSRSVFFHLWGIREAHRKVTWKPDLGGGVGYRHLHRDNSRASVRECACVLKWGGKQRFAHLFAYCEAVLHLSPPLWQGEGCWMAALCRLLVLNLATNPQEPAGARSRRAVWQVAVWAEGVRGVTGDNHHSAISLCHP